MHGEVSAALEDRATFSNQRMKTDGFSLNKMCILDGCEALRPSAVCSTSNGYSRSKEKASFQQECNRYSAVAAYAVALFCKTNSTFCFYSHANRASPGVFHHLLQFIFSASSGVRQISANGQEGQRRGSSTRHVFVCLMCIQPAKPKGEVSTQI